MTKYFFYILTFLIFSCSISKDSLFIKISDKKLIKHIENYNSENYNGIKKTPITSIFLTSKRNYKNDIYYISSLNSMSAIYYFPITGFTKINGKPVFIFSVSDSLNHPSSYSEKFVEYISENMYDDMLLDSIWKDHKGYYVFNHVPHVLFHPQVWKIENDSIVYKGDEINLSKEGVIKSIDINYLEYYRIKNGGKDARIELSDDL